MLSWTRGSCALPKRFCQVTIRRRSRAPCKGRKLNEQNRLRYLIDSSFDIFSQISIEGGAPVPVGGFPVNGVVMPEPATILLMGLPLITLVGLRRPTA